MRLDMETSFTFDARGRMLLTNEPREDARRPAWRLVVGHTSDGDVVRFNADVPDPVPRELEAILDALARQAPVTPDYAGPAYYVADPLPAPPDAVRMTMANRDLVRETYPWLYDEVADWQPCFAVVRDGSGVSICFSSRIGPQAAAAGVDTLPEYRARGFASTVTAAWAAAIRASSRIAFYSTTWDNDASQGVARRLGLSQFGEHLSWR